MSSLSRSDLPVTLSPVEWSLVWRLREIAPGRLKNEVTALVRQMLELAQQPRCAEAQADGVPCDSAAADCVECQNVALRLARVRTALGRG
jgi:hypothetical protein